jgi:hypothetical protein
MELLEMDATGVGDFVLVRAICGMALRNSSMDWVLMAGMPIFFIVSSIFLAFKSRGMSPSFKYCQFLL